MQQRHDFVCITKFNHINFQVKIYILFLVLERGGVLFLGVGVGEEGCSYYIKNKLKFETFN